MRKKLELLIVYLLLAFAELVLRWTAKWSKKHAHLIDREICEIYLDAYKKFMILLGYVGNYSKLYVKTCICMGYCADVIFCWVSDNEQFLESETATDRWVRSIWEEELDLLDDIYKTIYGEA